MGAIASRTLSSSVADGASSQSTTQILGILQTVVEAEMGALESVDRLFRARAFGSHGALFDRGVI